MSNLIEQKLRKDAKNPMYLKCKVCGQDMKVPTNPEIWAKWGAELIESNIKEFRKTHNKCRAPQQIEEE